MLKLSKIELSGFKSFAGSETIDFERPVTAVVGPNGSGKSNILDAILFAFGEQSPHRLRTSKMDALIFGGSGDTKRLNFTNVKITFVPQIQCSIPFRTRTPLPGENGRGTLITGNGNGNWGTEYVPLARDGAVTLERRLYRDGVSEYLLNGESVRLKDVDDFFGSYGLGRGAQIAITQGEVERKILANHQEMRSWLVSACGIGLLIDRKKRAEEKLEATRTNLERVSDLIGSTRRRINALTRERDDAHEHEKHSRRLSVLKLESLRRELADCYKSLRDNQATLNEIQNKLSVYGATSEDAEKKRNDAESELEAARNAIESRMTEQATMQRRYDEIDARVKSLDVELRMSNESLKSHIERASVAKLALGGDYERMETIKDDYDKLSKALVLLDNKYKGLTTDFERCESVAAVVRSEYDKAIVARLDIERRTRDFEHRLNAAAAAVERAAVAKAKLDGENKKLSEAINESSERLIELENARSEAFRTVRETDAETAATTEKLAEQRCALDAANRKRDEVRDSQAAVTARLESLRSLEAEAEGFAPGKKALLTDEKLKKCVGGARDPWRSVEFPSKYALAVGLVFSAYEDAIEVGDLTNGAQVLAEFHAKGVGRVRLTTTLAASADDSDNNDGDFNALPSKPDWWKKDVIRFYEVVSGDKAWLKRLYAETGEVAIANTLDEALIVVNELPQLSRAVVIDGSVVVSKSEASGGAPSAGSSVLSRRVTIDELAVESVRLNVEYASADSTMIGADVAVKETQTELGKLTEQRARYAKEVAVLDERIAAINARLKELKLNYESVNMEIEETAREEGRLKAEMENRAIEFEIEQAKLKHAEELAAESATNLAAAERELSRVRGERSTAGEELRVVKLNVNHLAMQMSDLDRRIRDAKAQLDTAECDIAALNEKIEKCENALNNSKMEYDSSENALTRAKTMLERARSNAEDKRKQLDEMKVAARDADDNRARFERDLQRFDVARGRLLYRYHDLWKNWHEGTQIVCGALSFGAANSTAASDNHISPLTNAIVNEALTLVKAYYEVEGLTVEDPRPDRSRIRQFWTRIGLAEPDYLEDDAVAPKTKGIADDGAIERLFEDVDAPHDYMNDENSLQPCHPDLISAAENADNDSHEQMHIMDAAEVMISGWDTNGLPEPPNPPSLVENLEKMSRTALREAFLECESAIAKLGQVNMKAPSQWEEESARLSFFILQESDVRNALAQLMDLLTKLDKETLRKYTTRTEKISARFKEYFHFLFGGGDVAINFTEPADTLASGVEIFVTLPGDRKQPLRSLSGGERSLVFLALFLAAHATGSGAFCVMDEADASLDDANILRLGRLLDAVASHTQLILVTHNKRTMELGDGLVGVVCRPKGVSRIIPVNLAKAQEFAEAVVKT